MSGMICVCAHQRHRKNGEVTSAAPIKVCGKPADKEFAPGYGACSDCQRECVTTVNVPRGVIHGGRN